MPVTRHNLPADLRLKLYRETMQLRSERGWGYRRIATELTKAHGLYVPKGTVSNWILGNHSPIRRLHRYFQPIPSPELSYIIGAVLGDGYVTEDRGRGIVGFTNKDRDLLEYFLICLSRLLSAERAGRITSGTRYGVFKVTVGCRMLALFLQRPLRDLESFIEEQPAAFVSGFFDADGHASISLHGGRLRLVVGASNTNIEVLKYISELLRSSWGIESRTNIVRRYSPPVIRGQTVKSPKTLYSLSIHRFADVETFLNRIGFKSKKKQGLLEDAVHLLHAHGSRAAVQFWQQSYTKVGYRWGKVTLPYVTDGGPGET